MTKINNKGQEEMVGFVLIVLLVVIIAVVFLGISLRKDNSQQEILENEEVNSFLTSLRSLTTSCEIRGELQNIEELAISCIEGDICSNEENSCKILSKTLDETLDKSTFVVSEESNKQYYILTVKSDNRDIIEPLFKTSGNTEIGKCPSTKITSMISLSSDEETDIKLEVCYKN